MQVFDYSTFGWNFCPKCASKLATVEEEGRQRRTCPSCRRFYYDNPICVAMCAVTRGPEEILLVRRGVEPKRGFWSLPGGFMEIGEAAEDAAARELLEEAGICAGAGSLLGVFAQKSAAHGTVLVIGYRFTAGDALPAPGSDVIDARFFPFDSLPDLAFDSNVYFAGLARRESRGKREQD